MQSLIRAFNLSAETDTQALSRRDIARRLLEGSWTQQLRKVADLDLVGFARGPVGELNIEAMVKRLALTPTPDDPASLATDWNPVLERALEMKSDAPILGVVLLSDGRQNSVGQAESTDLRGRLESSGIPVHSVMIGSTTPPRDAAIVTVQSPERAFEGDVVDVSVEVKLDGEVPGSEVPITLESPGVTALRKSVRVAATSNRPRVTFQVPTSSIGRLPISVRVGPLSEDEQPENDSRLVSIEVTGEKSRVLLIDGQPGWEFRYLWNALSRDRHVDLAAVILDPDSSSTMERVHPSRLPTARPGEPDPLAAFDLIILGDVSRESWPTDLWPRLEHYVNRRGGSLVLATGARVGSSLATEAIARDLLPSRHFASCPVNRCRTIPLIPVCRRAFPQSLSMWSSLVSGRCFA